MTITLPIYVRTVDAADGQGRVYEVRPLFHPAPARRDPSLERASNLLATDLAVTAYRTPEGIGRPGSIEGNPRRVYRRDQRRVDEVDLDRRFDWTSPELADALAPVIEFRLKRAFEGLLDG